jgi:phosphoribosylanthranilate isomerase
MPLRTRVKICGITQATDALAAINSGADALGFVFYDKSPRCVDVQSVEKITNEITPFINKVALFVNANYDYVCNIIQSLPIDLLQFHGDEDEAYCESFGKPYIKAVRMKGSTNLLELEERYASASGLLVDAFDSGQYGGTGKTFDWSLLPKSSQLPIILAGGLTVSNVYEAASHASVYAVDVSSGVEQSKGVKDHQLIQQFMHEVKRANK